MQYVGRIAALLIPLLLSQSCSSRAQGNMPKAEGWEVLANYRQPPEKVLDAIGVKPGMVIGEVGAGTGRVTVWLADRVGPQGHVYANDIDESALRHLQARCDRQNLKNVTTILGTVDDPRLPPQSLDIAFMTNTYHHLAQPVDLVRKLRSSLKENGILAIVERDADRSGSRHEATVKDDFTRQMDQAGFEVFRIETFLKEDNIYIARAKPGEHGMKQQ